MVSTTSTTTSSLKPITLHALDFWGAPNPRKVAIVLELLHLPYEVNLWKFSTAPNGLEGPVFTSTVNQVGRVPVIHDPNTGIDASESAAIINYLVRTFDKEGKVSLTEEDSEQDKVDADAWTHFLVCGLAAQTSNLHFFKKQGEAGKVGGERMEGLMTRSWRLFEGRLREKGGWAVGGRVTVVDAHFYPWIRAGREVDGVKFADFPAVGEWFERMDEMGDVRKGYERVTDGVKM